MLDGRCLLHFPFLKYFYFTVKAYITLADLRNPENFN